MVLGLSMLRMVGLSNSDALGLALFSNPVYKYMLIAVVIIIVILIISAVSSKEHMTTVEESKAPIVEPSKQEVKTVKTTGDDTEFAKVELPVNGEMITPEDLLPKTQEVKQFENQFPVGDGDIKGKNFLIASHNFGINTVGSSNKNPNLQLRSDPAIPRVSVGPWNNSSIEPSDLTNRKVFEISG